MRLKKTVTITFMAGPTEKAKQWTLPRWLFHAFFAIGTLCVIGGIGLGFFYAYEARKFVTYRQLVKETREQKVHLDRYRKELESLEAQLSEVNLLDGQVRQMTSGKEGPPAEKPKAPPAPATPPVPSPGANSKNPVSPTPDATRKMSMDDPSVTPSSLPSGTGSGMFLGDAFQRETRWEPPILGWETSPFGRRLSPLGAGEEFHPGIDIAQIEGMPVKATASGYVVKTGNAPDYGNYVLLYHGLGVTSLYAHLGRINVSAGDSVEKGSTLGVVGMSGLTNGPHLHFEIRYFGLPIDPGPFVDRAGSAKG